MEKTEKIEKNVWKLQDGYEIPQIGFGNYNSFFPEGVIIADSADRIRQL